MPAGAVPQPDGAGRPSGVENARKLLTRVTQIREQMQRSITSITDDGDRAFARMIDRVAAEAYRRVSHAISKLEIDSDTDSILRNERNLKLQTELMLQIKTILDRANQSLRAGHPTFRAMLDGAKAAVDHVKSLARIGNVSIPLPEIWSTIDADSIESAWLNVRASLKHFDERLMRVVRNEMTAAVLVGRTREQLQSKFMQLNVASDKLAGLQRPDAFHRNRARQQVRAELTRVYTTTMHRNATAAGFQLFEHFGPVDARNVLDITTANDPGTVDAKWRLKGSQDFIGDVLTADEWSRVSPNWSGYGLHYGERGGFQPVMPDWPGVAAKWRQSEREHGFAQAEIAESPMPEVPKKVRVAKPLTPRQLLVAEAKAAGVDPAYVIGLAKESQGIERDHIRQLQDVIRRARV